MVQAVMSSYHGANGTCVLRGVCCVSAVVEIVVNIFRQVQEGV